ncbi:MAG: recombinase family protein [Paracoccaceae bacterium]
MSTDFKEKPKPTEAVIYCRVSSAKQVQEGHGLNSQETRCREYATRLGYTVLEVFPDKAISGGKLDRPSFNEMLTFVERQTSGIAVIIDDISRFSRDIESHWALRRALSAVGGRLESPSIKFGEDAHSVLIENLLASVSQHQRQHNGEQTKNRMRARHERLLVLSCAARISVRETCGSRQVAGTQIANGKHSSKRT